MNTTDDIICTCGSCGLNHPLVEAHGIWHCPNAMCRGGGGAWFRAKLKSYKEQPRDTHSVDEQEWAAQALLYCLTVKDDRLCEFIRSQVSKFLLRQAVNPLDKPTLNPSYEIGSNVYVYYPSEDQNPDICTLGEIYRARCLVYKVAGSRDVVMQGKVIPAPVLEPVDEFACSVSPNAVAGTFTHWRKCLGKPIHTKSTGSD